MNPKRFRGADRIPSPATVIAIVALFISLGGTVYAAAMIGSEDIQKNAVKRVHVSKGAVAGKQVKNGSLTRSDLKPPRLTRVAPASSADCSEVVEFCGPAGGSWANYPPPQSEIEFDLADNTNPGGYSVDALGYVHLQGTVGGGYFTGGGIDSCFEPTQEIFFLPQKLWPAHDVLVPAVVGISRRAGSICADPVREATLVEISDRGAVTLTDIKGAEDNGFVEYLTLDGITFKPR